MSTVLYVSTDRIRAVLGLTAKELTDTQITDLSVEARLRIRLADVYPDHEALAADIDDSSATPEQVRVWNILLTYLDYQAAAYLLPQIQMLVVKRISDGDADMLRFGPDDLAQLREEIRAVLDEYLALLNPDLHASDDFNVFSGVRPAYDPVTFSGSETL